jgi:AAA+ superfamily predicted ATPase
MSQKHMRRPGSRTPILKVIEAVYEELKGSQLSEHTKDRHLARLKADLSRVSRFFGCSHEEAMFFCVIFGLKVVLNSVYYNDVISYLECNPFFMVGSESVLKSLQKKRLILRDDNYGRGSANLNITREAYNAVISNKPIGTAQTHFENMYVLLQRIDNLIVERRREAISTNELFEEVYHLLHAETHIPFVRNLNKLHLSTRELTILLYMCYYFANGDEYVDLNEMLNMIFDMMGEKVSMKRDMINKEADLVKKELVEFENDYFLMGRSVKLSDYAIETLFEEEAVVFEKKKVFRPNNARLIECKDIREKHLFFNPEECRSLEILERLLSEQQLEPVLKRFEEAGMPRGIVVLLYGEPGTGKTECVYDLARKSERNLLMVDIAQIKDKYVGESEKHIKQVFDNYRKARDYFERTPILLFNESDALISRRIEVNSSVDQMNNSMQNILLQELESFEGILFATSNLSVNLDKAFERRFLYKILFTKPNTHTRLRIWQDKMPQADTPMLEKLAQRYEFTGGQIDNVVRKYLLENILHACKPGLSEMEALCQQELFGEKSWGKVGF